MKESIKCQNIKINAKHHEVPHVLFVLSRNVFCCRVNLAFEGWGFFSDIFRHFCHKWRSHESKYYISSACHWELMQQSSLNLRIHTVLSSGMVIGPPKKSRGLNATAFQRRVCQCFCVWLSSPSQTLVCLPGFVRGRRVNSLLLLCSVWSVCSRLCVEINISPTVFCTIGRRLMTFHVLRPSWCLKHLFLVMHVAVYCAPYVIYASKL